MDTSNALIIIDMLNDFVNENAPLKVPGIEKTIPAISRAIEVADKNSYPVIYLCDRHEKDDEEFDYFPPHAIKGTDGAEIIEELGPRRRDTILYKKYYSGFFHTDLEKTLQDLDTKKIIICGCVINICVLFTAADAFMRGYGVSVIEDGLASFNEEDHDYMIRYFRDILKIDVL